MFLTRCPECNTNVEVPEEDAISVRCTSCGFKIVLRESDREREEREYKEKRKAKPKLPPKNLFLEMLPILISVPLSLFFLLLTCIFPKFVFFSIAAAFFVGALGFGKSIMLAMEEGNWVGPDYLESIGGVKWAIYFLFFGLYVTGFCLLWEICVIGCAIQKPKIYLPWIGLQAYGMLAFVLAIAFAVIGTYLQERL